MSILDTNVVAEAVKPEPHSAVQARLNDQAADTMYLSCVTAELLSGMATLPLGKRKEMLAQALEALLDLFKDRVLPFDTAAARCYAELAMTAHSKGRGFPTPAGDIASIAAARGFMEASRDVAPFVDPECRSSPPGRYR